MEPLLKWAGGKRRLVDYIVAKTGTHFNTYFEPFLGGASMLLAIKPRHAICSDINEELVNFYNVVKESSIELINELNNHYIPFCGDKGFYYQTRSLDRDNASFEKLSEIQRAARFIFLNKTCYNGLWRVNRKGENNVPWGQRNNPSLFDLTNLINVSRYFNESEISFLVSDYKRTAQMAQCGDLVYFDPPYDDESKLGFNGYTKEGFSRMDQISLRNVCNELVDRGVKVAVSNSNTSFIRDLFSDADMYQLFDDVELIRFIGSSKDSRKKATELLIVSK